MLVTAIGSPYANSYITLEKADDVMPLHDRTWPNRTESEKIYLIRAAASDLERVPYLGTKMFYGQKLQFPRRGDTLVTSHAVTTGFAKVTGEYTTNVTREQTEDATYSRQQTADTVTFLFGDADFLAAAIDKRAIILTGPVRDSQRHLRLTLKEVSRSVTYITPEVRDDFGTIVSPAESGQRIERVWTVSEVAEVAVDGTVIKTPLPEVLPTFTLNSAGVFTVSATNGSPVEIPSGITSAVSVLYVTETTTTTGVLPNKIQNTALVHSDRNDILPTFCWGAGLHVIHNGTREYATVTAHDINSGTITLDMDVVPATGGEFIYIDPIRDEIIDAQIEQLKVRTGVTVTDPFAGMGLRSVKIGDTSRTYGDAANSSQAMNNIAGRLGISVRSLILIGKFTTYGKVMIGWQKRIEDALSSPIV